MLNMSEYNTSDSDNDSLEKEFRVENSQSAQTSKHSPETQKSTHARTRSISPMITGIFWIGVGVVMLLMNFFPKDTSMSLIQFVRYWGMLFAGIYVLLFSLLGYMRKMYFFVGVCSVALWLGHVIESSSNINTKTVWPIIMIVISLAIILYGVVFKKHKLKNYVVAGSMFLAFSLLVLVSVLQSFDVSQFLRKGWPVFLVFLGASYIYNRKCAHNRKNKSGENLTDK